MSEWSDDAAFWQAMEPALCAPARLALAEGEVTTISAAGRLRPNSRVLDLACGPGAHAIAFARLGHRVTGVDTSVRLLDRARSAARSAGVEVEWVEGDMREFQRPGAFDLICSLYTSFGYFDDRQNRHVLENARSSLAPGGVLLLDVTGREVAARHWQESQSHEVDGVRYLERRTAADDWSSMTSDWIVMRSGIRADFRVRLRLYAGPELRELLLSVGFASVQLAGGLDPATPYDESARRLVALARGTAARTQLTAQGDGR